jgi:hypothetical protein
MTSRTRKGTRVALPLAVAVGLGTTLALAPAGTAAGDFDFKSGNFTGKTSQKDESGAYLPLQLSVSKDKKTVTVVFFELSAPPCGGGGMGTLQYAGLKAKVKKNGSFNAKFKPYGSVKGNLDGSIAKGTARYEVHQNGVNCDSGRITWRAKRSR